MMTLKETTTQIYTFGKSKIYFFFSFLFFFLFPSEIWIIVTKKEVDDNQLQTHQVN